MHLLNLFQKRKKKKRNCWRQRSIPTYSLCLCIWLDYYKSVLQNQALHVLLYTVEKEKQKQRLNKCFFIFKCIYHFWLVHPRWTVNMRCKCGLSHFINFRRMNIITLTNYKQNASDWKNHLRIHIHPDLKRKTETQALIPTAESSLSMGLVAHTLLGWSGRTSPALDASWVVCTRTPPCTVFSCKTHKQTKQSLKHNLMILVISEPIPH